MFSVISVFLSRFSNKSFFTLLVILELPEKSHFQILSGFILRFSSSLTFSLHLQCLGVISSIMQFLPFSFLVIHVFRTSRSYLFTPTHAHAHAHARARTTTQKHTCSIYTNTHTHTHTHTNTHTHSYTKQLCFSICSIFSSHYLSCA